MADAFLGGWSLTGIFRWNTGLPAGQPFDDGRWATNWNVQANTVAIRPLKTSPTRTGDPNLFEDPLYAYQSYRHPSPGEQGDRGIEDGDGPAMLAAWFSVGRSTTSPTRSTSPAWTVMASGCRVILI